MYCTFEPKNLDVDQKKLIVGADSLVGSAPTLCFGQQKWTNRSHTSLRLLNTVIETQ